MDDRARYGEGCDEERKDTANLRSTLRQETEKLQAMAAGREMTLGEHLLKLEHTLDRKLRNLRRLRGALSNDALSLPASILE